MLWITIHAFILDKSHIHLPFSTEECPAEILSMYNATSSITAMDTTV